MIQTVKGFGMVNKAEVDVLKFCYFFHDPTDVGNLISSSSAFLNPAWTPGSSRFAYIHTLLRLSRFSHVRLCDPMDGSPPGSPVPGILQARTLEWVAIAFCNAWKWKVKVKSLSCVWLLATPWTVAYQAPPSMGFSRQEYWSGVPLPSPLLFVFLH